MASRAPASTSPDYIVQLEDERDGLLLKLAEAEETIRKQRMPDADRDRLARLLDKETARTMDLSTESRRAQGASSGGRGGAAEAARGLI